MKKIITSAAIAIVFVSSAFAGNRPHGYATYKKHQKHHHAKVYHPQHKSDPTYQN